MKYWFFVAVLANVVFLLWEFHYGTFDAAELPDAAENSEKRILLVSELNTDAQGRSAGRSASLTEKREVLPPSPQRDEAARSVPVAAGAQDAAAETETLAEVSERQRQPEKAEKERLPLTESAVLAATPAPIPTAGENTATAVTPVIADNGQSAEPPDERQTTARTITANEPAEPASQEAEVLQTACYKVGPVENRVAFEALLDTYRTQISSVEFSIQEKRKNDSHIVYYPAEATLEQSIATAEMFRRDYGIRDLLVFRNGELKGAISLGVFSNAQRAKTAQSQFEKKGLYVVVRPRYPTETHYSLHVRWNDRQASAAEQLSDVLKQGYSARRQSAAGCQ
ncbi:MAG: hypothetical protein ACU837_10465 [Gammaproteobacteria bacterium]